MNEVFETKDEMMAHVMGVAKEIASKDPLAVTGCKVLINYGRDHSTADTLDYIGVWNSGMIPPSHMQEAFAAKAEKREAEYPDLSTASNDTDVAYLRPNRSGIRPSL